MKLNKMAKEELELLSYMDLAKLIIKEEKKSLNTPTVFKKICELLELSDEEYEDKIGDFYTSLTTDKRFIFLDDGTWDLKDNHKVKIVLDDEDEETEEVVEEEIVEPELDYETMEEGVDEDDEDVEDEIAELSIIDENIEDEEDELQ